MPKTYTDDLGFVLPSLIDGPFQIADPADAGSWIKIDPASATVAAAGGARPTRTLTTGYLRSYLSPAQQFIGTAIPARSVNYLQNGGMTLAPLTIPLDMDVTRPSDVTILVAPLTTANPNGRVARLSLLYTHATQNQTVGETELIYDWPIPENWTASQPILLTFDNGQGRTFEPDTFTGGDVLGLRIARYGLQDSFLQGLKLAEYARLVYTAKEF